ncbi:hypothetical protein [Crenothrix sp.]|uniref:hypothetical protein n=1 Tax=Crenothrix sp. TaxID=3100433 RepID=UPI00374D1AC9
MKAKILLPALIAGLVAVTGVQAGKYPAPTPEDTSGVDYSHPAPATPAPVYEPCYRAELVHGKWDNYGKRSGDKYAHQSKTVDIGGKTYKLKGLELICVEPAPAPVVAPPPAGGGNCHKTNTCPDTGTDNGYPK